jgi:hypothetical protein
VIEHLHNNLRAPLISLLSLLEPNGLLIIETPISFAGTRGYESFLQKPAYIKSTFIIRTLVISEVMLGVLPIGTKKKILSNNDLRRGNKDFKSDD